MIRSVTCLWSLLSPLFHYTLQFLFGSLSTVTVYAIASFEISLLQANMWCMSKSLSGYSWVYCILTFVCIWSPTFDWQSIVEVELLVYGKICEDYRVHCALGGSPERIYPDSMQLSYIHHGWLRRLHPSAYTQPVLSRGCCQSWTSADEGGVSLWFWRPSGYLMVVVHEEMVLLKWLLQQEFWGWWHAKTIRLLYMYTCVNVFKWLYFYFCHIVKAFVYMSIVELFNDRIRFRIRLICNIFYIIILFIIQYTFICIKRDDPIYILLFSYIYTYMIIYA